MEDRIKKLYLPLFNKINEWREKSGKKTFVVGISGSQGVGKSFICSQLVKIFAENKINAVTVSIDDFYLTLREQTELYKIGNPYLGQRAWPGTHDIKLGEETLFKLINSTGKVKVPIYDKSLFNGKGDRLKEEDWKIVDAPPDVILLEGWMLGFRARYDIKNKELDFMNKKLDEYASWYKYLDSFVSLVPEKTSYIIDWRIEAEENMKKTGRTGMTEEETRNYISKFMIAYDLYLPDLKSPIDGPSLKIKIGKDRMPSDNFGKN